MRAILFDLDGTLLPMNLEEFTAAYFRLLSGRFSEYDPNAFIAAVWQGTKAMMSNDGTMTNEARFWQTFSRIMGDTVLGRDKEFEDFYRTDFHKAKSVTGANPLAKTAVAWARQKADLVVLATNHLFPACDVETRLSWLGLTPADFDYITTYDNSSFCKPDTRYYHAICHAVAVSPADCLMIGNDLKEDGWGASQAGMQVHIVTDCLISHGLHLSDFSHSTFAELKNHL